METASISEVKNGLSAIIDRVKGGESIVVTDRGIPVAVIEPVSGRIDVEDRLARLERAGLMKRGNGRGARGVPPDARAQLPDGVSLVDYILEERRSGW